MLLQLQIYLENWMRGESDRATLYQLRRLEGTWIDRAGAEKTQRRDRSMVLDMNQGSSQAPL